MESPKICIYTVIFGDYDQLHPHVKQNIPCDYLCFTNNPNLQTEKDFFQIIIDDPLPRSGLTVHPVNQNIAKTILYRTNLQIVPALKKYDVCVYIDANAKIADPNLISTILAQAGDADLILNRHPIRDCVFEEAIVSKSIDKYKYTDLSRQTKDYQADGLKPHSGLYWNGFMAFLKPFDSKMDLFYQMYTDHMLKYTTNPKKYYHPQGQVSSIETA